VAENAGGEEDEPRQEPAHRVVELAAALDVRDYEQHRTDPGDAAEPVDGMKAREDECQDGVGRSVSTPRNEMKPKANPAPIAAQAQNHAQPITWFFRSSANAGIAVQIVALG
jgi:hypothetical protein